MCMTWLRNNWSLALSLVCLGAAIIALVGCGAPERAVAVPVHFTSHQLCSATFVALERHETRAGGITKTGNAHLRRVLVESAWHYRHHPFVSATLRARQRGAPAQVITRAWTAQQRLHRRYQRLAASGTPKQHVVTAVARELTGFVWAALTQ
jgi:hypothetical protein